MPITWDELDDTQPDRWTVQTGPDRLDANAWSGFDEQASDLTIAHTAVMTLLDTAGLELEKFDRFRS